MIVLMQEWSLSGRDGRLEKEEDGVEKGGKEWAALEEAKEEQGEK